MVAFNKFQAFTDDLAEGIHTLATDQLDIATTAAASPPVNTNTVLANLTETNYTNQDADRSLTTSSSTQTGGQYSLVNADEVLVATGTVAGFRYIVMFNQTANSPLVDPLIAWWDYGSDLVLLNTESLTLDFGATTFTLGA